MTYEEAREILRMGCCYEGYNHKKCTECEYAFAFEALKKQMPKKPRHEHLNFYCSCCGKWLLWDDAEPNVNDMFCSKCGQHIDWSEDDE